MRRLGYPSFWLLLLAMAFCLGMLSAHERWPVYGVFVERILVQFDGRKGVSEFARRHYAQRRSLFAELPAEADLVLIGDSLTAQGEWQELLPDLSVHNRGIGFDTAEGVAARLTSICDGRYRIAALAVGINDLIYNIPVSKTRQYYRESVETLMHCVNHLVLHTVLQPSRQFAIASRVREANRFIHALGERYGLAVVDLNPVLAPGGYLLERYTKDGLHLTGQAYLIWAGRLRELLPRSHPRIQLKKAASDSMIDTSSRTPTTVENTAPLVRQKRKSTTAAPRPRGPGAHTRAGQRRQTHALCVGVQEDTWAICPTLPTLPQDCDRFITTTGQ